MQCFHRTDISSCSDKCVNSLENSSESCSFTKAQLISCLFARPSLRVPGIFLHSSLDLDLLWLPDKERGHQVETDKAELPLNVDIHSDAKEKNNSWFKDKSQQVTSCRHP